jgi:hypothetical protein
MLGGLAGCATFEMPRWLVADGCEAGACDGTGDEALSGILRYGEYIRTLNPDAQRREYQRAKIAFTRDESVANQFRLALLLSLPGTEFQSDARARELLLQYLKHNDDTSGYRPFAVFLLRTLNERQAIERTAEAERRQVEMLRKQVEELKAIERRINRRNAARPPVASP